MLQVQPARPRLAGEVDPQDRDVWSFGAWDEGEDGVLGWPGLNVSKRGSLKESPELLDQLCDLSVVEVQLSSSAE